MELLQGGTLAQLIKRRSLSDAEAAIIMRGILRAVSYLHSRDVLHRDLKPDNVMFLNDDLSSVKIADFGLSAKFGQYIFARTFEDMCGTVAFMAPEQILHKNYSKPVDIWSCAIILLMIITGKHPLLSQGDTMAVYTQKLQNPMWEFSNDLNPLARQLFLHMTNMQPLERYTADQALRHPWITREETEIPKTYLERIADYNAESQFKRIISALVATGALLYIKHGKIPLYEPALLPVPSISEPLPLISGHILPSALPPRPALYPSALSPSSLRSLQHRNTLKLEISKKTEFRRRSTDLVSLGFAHRSPTRDLLAHSPTVQKSTTTLRPIHSSYLRKPRVSPTANHKVG
jgi:serine/threonine protein kinase